MNKNLFLSLPEDIAFFIFSMLDIDSLLIMRATSREMLLLIKQYFENYQKIEHRAIIDDLYQDDRDFSQLSLNIKKVYYVNDTLYCNELVKNISSDIMIYINTAHIYRESDIDKFVKSNIFVEKLLIEEYVALSINLQTINLIKYDKLFVHVNTFTISYIDFINNNYYNGYTEYIYQTLSDLNYCSENIPMLDLTLSYYSGTFNIGVLNRFQKLKNLTLSKIISLTGINTNIESAELFFMQNTIQNGILFEEIKFEKLHTLLLSNMQCLILGKLPKTLKVLTLYSIVNIVDIENIGNLDKLIIYNNKSINFCLIHKNAKINYGHINEINIFVGVYAKFINVFNNCFRVKIEVKTLNLNINSKNKTLLYIANSFMNCYELIIISYFEIDKIYITDEVRKSIKIITIRKLNAI